MGRKGQSAMEYLMTYGWAILVIIIVIAVLFYIGVLNPRNVTPSTCTFPPGISCASYKLIEGSNPLKSGNLELTLGQALGHPISITGLVCTQETGAPSNWDVSGFNTSSPIPIPIGEARKVSGSDVNQQIYCLDSNGNRVQPPQSQLGEFYKGKLWIRYSETDTNTERTVVGDIATKFETG